MRFSAILSSLALGVLSVQAQNATMAATATTSGAVSGTQAATGAQVTEAACLAACASNDADCAAECVANSTSVNPIALCQSDCTQGNGTASENLAYESCISECIDEVAAVTSGASAIIAAPSTMVTTGANGVVSTITSAASTATGFAQATMTSARASGTSSSSEAGAPTNVAAVGRILGLAALAAML